MGRLFFHYLQFIIQIIRMNALMTEKGNQTTSSLCQFTRQLLRSDE